MIDRNTIEKVKEAARIEDVVSDFVTLRRAGSNLKGLCPFHDERTPSFFVSPSRNLCKCFACGVGGNPVSFIMQHEKISYTDAIRYLAKKYSIPIAEREMSPEEMLKKDERESMFILNAWARDWFRKQLLETDDGRAFGLTYLHSRGFRDDVIERFQVGFCPRTGANSLAADALKSGFKERFLLNDNCSENDSKAILGTGLVRKNEQGKLRDRFQGRVIWPILSMSGRVTGFAGRVLDLATKGINAKYVNSPESLVYSKRRELFGLFQAKQAISHTDAVYLVEGYTDVMGLSQVGILNAVATSGTALSDEQVTLLRRFTSNAVLVFDGDDAGVHAALRGVDILLRAGMNVKVVALPPEADPDSFSRQHSAAEVKQYFAEHEVDFIKFKAGLLKNESRGDPGALVKLANELANSISLMPDDVARAVYTQQAAQALGLEENVIAGAVLRALSAKNSGSNSGNFPRPNAVNTPDRVQSQGAVTASDGPKWGPQDVMLRLENELAKAVLLYGGTPMQEDEQTQSGERPMCVTEFIVSALERDGNRFQSPLPARIIAEASAHFSEPGFDAGEYFTQHEDAELSAFALDLMAEREQLSRNFQAKVTPSELVPHLLTDYNLCLIKEKIGRAMKEMSRPEVAQDDARCAELLTLIKRLKDDERRLSRAGGDRVLSS